ncbi:MAG: hypothetical protein KAR13_11545, partial [Desulfobulbaceae bacterium]|nr:hypothetical protein [Desulfobulbaceae bacterium]
LELIFEHRLYLPSIGFFLVIVSLADRACNHFALDNRQTFQNIFLLGIIIVSCILSSLTTIRNHAWRDPVSLWRDCAQKSPYKPRPLINYGIALEKAGSQDEAMVALEKGMAVGRKHYEEYLVAASNIVYIHFSKGEFKEARHRGEKFLNSVTAGLDKSGLSELTLNMAKVYRATGEPVKSFLVLAHGFDLQRKATHLLKALEIMLTEANNSTDGDREKLGLSGEPVDIPLKIALLLLDMREYEKCALYLNKALKLNPHHEKSLETKKRLLENMEKRAKAIFVSDIHNDQDFRENRLFRLYMSLADFILNNYSPLKFMVVRFLEAAGEIRPNNPFVPLYIARRHMEMEHMEEAVRTIEKSIPDNPDFPPLLELAGLCYMKTDKPIKAAIAYQHLLEIYPGHPNWKRYKRVIQMAQQEISGK